VVCAHWEREWVRFLICILFPGADFAICLSSNWEVSPVKWVCALEVEVTSLAGPVPLHAVTEKAKSMFFNFYRFAFFVCRPCRGWLSTCMFIRSNMESGSQATTGQSREKGPRHGCPRFAAQEGCLVLETLCLAFDVSSLQVDFGSAYQYQGQESGIFWMGSVLIHAVPETKSLQSFADSFLFAKRAV
jgi:hypothetical protein